MCHPTRCALLALEINRDPKRCWRDNPSLCTLHICLEHDTSTSNILHCRTIRCSTVLILPLYIPLSPSTMPLPSSPSLSSNYITSTPFSSLLALSSINPTSTDPWPKILIIRECELKSEAQLEVCDVVVDAIGFLVMVHGSCCGAWMPFDGALVLCSAMAAVAVVVVESEKKLGWGWASEESHCT